MIITKRFIKLVGETVLFVLLGAILGQGKISFLLANIFLIAIIVYDYTNMAKPEEIKVKRDDVDKLSIFERELISFEVSNTGNRKVEVLVKDTYPPFHFDTQSSQMELSLEPNQTKEISYTVLPTKRGVFKFTDIYTRVVSPMGFCMREIILKDEKEYKVYPNVKDLKKYRIMAIKNKQISDGKKTFKKLGDGREFESLREYVSGDDYRRINWKATARENKPIINQYEPEKNQHIYAFIDTGRAMSYSIRGQRKLDTAINTALILTDIANQNGDLSGVMTVNTEVKSYISPGKGFGHRNQIMETLYGIEATNDSPNFDEAFIHFKTREKRRSMIVLFTDFEIVHEAEEMLKSIKLLSKNHVVMIFLIKDDKYEKIINSKPKTEKERIKVAVAHEMIENRIKLIRVLNSMGIMCIECESEKLSMKVVNSYLELKNRR